LGGITNTIGSVTNPTAGSGNSFEGIANGNGNGNGNGNSAGVCYPPFSNTSFHIANAASRTTTAMATLLETTTRLEAATLSA
jgi:hypothetical protein